MTVLTPMASLLKKQYETGKIRALPNDLQQLVGVRAEETDEVCRTTCPCGPTRRGTGQRCGTIRPFRADGVGLHPAALSGSLPKPAHARARRKI